MIAALNSETTTSRKRDEEPDTTGWAKREDAATDDGVSWGKREDEPDTTGWAKRGDAATDDTTGWARRHRVRSMILAKRPTAVEYALETEGPGDEMLQTRGA